MRSGFQGDRDQRHGLRGPDRDGHANDLPDQRVRGRRGHLHPHPDGRAHRCEGRSIGLKTWEPNREESGGANPSEQTNHPYFPPWVTTITYTVSCLTWSSVR